MSRTLRTELTLPNDPEILEVARAYAQQLVHLAQLPAGEAGPLVEAVVEAASNVLDHAFEPDEEGTLRIIGEVTPTDLVISVCDHGLPFDPLRLAPSEGTSRHLTEGTGLAQIRKAVDKLDWIHRGREGKELRMVKHRPQRDVTEQDEGLEQMAEDAPLAPEQEYQITLFRPEHALGISRCIYRVYGNTYMHEDSYYPDRLIQLNRTGELVSVVALDEAGEVVGHYALERPRLTRVAERGMAVVSPDHRGRDLMGRMRVKIEEEAQRLGLIGVYSVAVTLHTYSQRVNEEYGSDVTGIMLGGSPAMVFKKIAGDNPAERVTWVIYHTYVQPPELSVVHAPPHHRAMMERIYQGLPVRVEFREGGPIPDIEGEIEVTYSHSQDNATIRVDVIGSDTCAELRRSTEDLFRITGADVVFVNIPLAQAAAPELCRKLEEEGFYFQGIGPSFARDGDALILGKLNVPLDPFAARIQNPFAQELLQYVAAERERVSALAGASG